MPSANNPEAAESDLKRHMQQQARSPQRSREESHAPEREALGRGKRIPLGTARIKGEADKRPGFVRRWINDSGARIEQALQGGWEFVSTDPIAASSDPGSRISQIAGTKEGGTPLLRYLMEIREEWWAEDQAAKQEHNDALEAQIKRGELIGEAAGMDQSMRYIPKGGIRIERKP